MLYFCSRMYKICVCYFIFMYSFCMMGQVKKIIYAFPRQGSDKRIFDSLTIDSSYTIQVIEYGAPARHQSMASFAKQLSIQIDTSRPFILLGVSLGGMICAELAEIITPEKTILISSAKNRQELPLRYKFQKALPVYKLFPGSVLLAGAKFLQPIVEPDRNTNKTTFKSMLAAKQPTYMRRTIDLIINWNRKQNTSHIYRIHGTKDHTLPIRKIKSPNFLVDNGSHMMTLTKAKEVSQIVNLILKQ